ncbi:MAG TPA: tyrosine-type recombinase/integrase [Acidimicrobiia bacterium]
MTTTTPRLRQLLDDWLIEFRSPGTRGSYRRAVEQFAEFIGRDVLEATRSDVRRWVAHISQGEGLKDSSVRQKASAVSSFYRHLKAEGLVDTNPAAEVRRPQGESEPRLGLSAHDARKLITQAESHSRMAAALVWLMAGAGLRVAEACTARIEDLDGDLLTVKVKGGHRQIKPLSEPVLAAVKAATGTRKEGTIVVDRDGHEVTEKKAQRLVRKLAKTAGITEKITPHILRHTAATLALEAGTPLEDVSALLGHRSLETTLRYVRNRDVIGGTREAAATLARTLTHQTRR